jgi:hypothetical protein
MYIFLFLNIIYILNYFEVFLSKNIYKNIQSNLLLILFLYFLKDYQIYLLLK